MPKVSVIMPVYNTASYLDESIGSILNQTLDDIEIIIVDDGSTDESYSVIDKYVKCCTKVKCLRQENKGLSVARNVGLSYATGTYIYFMDSDDILEKDCLKICYSECEKNSLDFICFDAQNFGSISLSVQEYDRSDIFIEHKIYNGIDFFDIMLENYKYRSPVWLHFVNAKFLRSWFKGFYPGIIHEDHLFTVKLYLNSERCGYINRKFFKRRLRNKSIMTNSFSQKNIIGYKVTIEELINYPRLNSKVNKVLEVFLSQILNAVVWQSHKLRVGQKLDLLLWLYKIKRITDISVRNYFVLFFK